MEFIRKKSKKKKKCININDLKSVLKLKKLIDKKELCSSFVNYDTLICYTYKLFFMHYSFIKNNSLFSLFSSQVLIYSLIP